MIFFVPIMGQIPHRHTVQELRWGLNPHCNSNFFPLPSSFFLRFTIQKYLIYHMLHQGLYYNLHHYYTKLILDFDPVKINRKIYSKSLINLRIHSNHLISPVRR